MVNGDIRVTAKDRIRIRNNGQISFHIYTLNLTVVQNDAQPQYRLYLSTSVSSALFLHFIFLKEL